METIPTLVENAMATYPGTKQPSATQTQPAPHANTKIDAFTTKKRHLGALAWTMRSLILLLVNRSALTPGINHSTSLLVKRSMLRRKPTKLRWPRQRNKEPPAMVPAFKSAVTLRALKPSGVSEICTQR